MALDASRNLVLVHSSNVRREVESVLRQLFKLPAEGVSENWQDDYDLTSQTLVVPELDYPHQTVQKEASFCLRFMKLHPCLLSSMLTL
jgi:hypothetical protein